MTDIIITIKKDINWNQYLTELKEADLRNDVSLFKLPTLPKKINHRDKCFITHNGLIKGYMYIIKAQYVYNGFKCNTNGIEWPEGNYVIRESVFHPVKEIPFKGFQGFRYINYAELVNEGIK